MRRDFAGVFCCLLLFLLPVSAVGERREILLTDEVQLRLGDAFLAEGEYYRAATKYMEFLHLFPDSPRTTHALLQLGMAHYLGGECERAVGFFSRVRATYAAAEFPLAAFYEGVCYSSLDNPLRAQDSFERAIAFIVSSPYAEKALIGKSLSRIGQDDVRGGREELERFPSLFPESPGRGDVDRAIAQVDANLATSRKSPGLAGMLSAVLPGSGQMYAGRYKDGVVALAVNSLFLAGTLVAIQHENYPAAVIIGGVGLPFYVGNIYGGANGARKWNVSLNRDLHDSLSVTLDYRY